MATLALSRLSSKFDRDSINPVHYMEQLGEFDNFQYMLDYVKRSLRSGPRQSLADQANKNKANKGSPAVVSAE